MVGYAFFFLRRMDTHIHCRASGQGIDIPLPVGDISHKAFCSKIKDFGPSFFFQPSLFLFIQTLCFRFVCCFLFLIHVVSDITAADCQNQQQERCDHFLHINPSIHRIDYTLPA